MSTACGGSSEPLRNESIIVNINTRVPDGDNELWNDKRMDWQNRNAEKDGGMVSAFFINHSLYSQIYGYDYKFFNARLPGGYHNTWMKPHVISSLLESYKSVVFIDADATVQHLELPIQWLFNRWASNRKPPSPCLYSMSI
ncbi:hypothetical protein G6514_003197 [Epicoccum nigrum]|nr:hypothetical protein G6514_003197 [Epicoccum nigrum]